MKLYIVFVTFKAPGNCGSYSPVRYVDSQWASWEHARDRKMELVDSLEMGKAPEYEVTIKTGKVADAAINERSPKKADAVTPEAQEGPK